MDSVIVNQRTSKLLMLSEFCEHSQNVDFIEIVKMGK